MRNFGKLSYHHTPSKFPLQPYTLYPILATHAINQPNAPFLMTPKITYSFDQFHQKALKLASFLLSLNLPPLPRIGLYLPNQPEYVLFQAAIHYIGGVVVTINSSYQQKELQYCSETVGLSLIITQNSFKKTPMMQYAESLDKVIKLNISENSQKAGWIQLADIENFDISDKVHSIAANQDSDEIVNIQFTSGTTGLPKAASLTSMNIINNAEQVGRLIDLAPEDRILCQVPFYHCFGIVMCNLASMVIGNGIVIPGESYNPDESLEAIEKFKCTTFYGVPTMYLGVMESQKILKKDTSSLSKGIIAGTICPPIIINRAREELNIQHISTCYGQTETSPVNCQTRIDDPFEKRTTTIGRPHPHCEIKIVDPETKKTVPRNHKGELCCRGYMVMPKYWNNEQATKQTIDENGWLYSGDLATMDEDGFVNIVGRIKDMIIRGGENVYPKEIEHYFLELEEVYDAQVVGVYDEKLGEEILIQVILKQNYTSIEKILEKLKGKIAHYKIPKYLMYVDQFPLTVTGKVQKYMIRDTFNKLQQENPENVNSYRLR